MLLTPEYAWPDGGSDMGYLEWRPCGTLPNIPLLEVPRECSPLLCLTSFPHPQPSLWVPFPMSQVTFRPLVSCPYQCYAGIYVHWYRSKVRVRVYLVLANVVRAPSVNRILDLPRKEVFTIGFILVYFVGGSKWCKITLWMEGHERNSWIPSDLKWQLKVEILKTVNDHYCGTRLGVW